MRARDVMSTDVATVNESATLLEAVKMLINGGASALPVVDGKGILVGILSEYDVIQHVLEGDRAFDLQDHLEAHGALPEVYARMLGGPVSGLMTKSTLSADEDTRLKEIGDLMVKHRVRAVPIVRDGSVVGLVNRVDLVKALLSRTDASAAPAPAEVDDEQLRRDVVAAIRRAGLAISGGFDVVARHGTVHLWGNAYTEEDHRSYRATAAKVAGVRDVASHMQVRPMRSLAGLRR
jgi:CBS domain-containing protein